MAQYYNEFTTTPSGLVAKLKTEIAGSSDWSNITGDIMKSTTTRGAELVVNVNKVAVTSIALGISAWRAHNGSTGTDESPTHYFTWRNSGGATSDTLYGKISASKEHLWISIEGPKAGDTNAVDTTTGSAATSLYLGDLVPYHAADTTPTCVLIAHSTATLNGVQTDYCYVGRDQGATRAWVPAQLATVCVPSLSAIQAVLNHQAKGDGKTYVFPWLVFESTDGLRGRLAEVFWAGYENNGAGVVNQQENGLAPGTDITYNSNTYTINRVIRYPNVSTAMPQTQWSRQSTTSAAGWGNAPLVAVRKA